MIALNYHHVGHPPKEFRYKKLFIKPEYLKHHIWVLKSLGFQFKTLAQWQMSNKQQRTVCITFDDGFLDNLESGFPVLSKENIPATIFCVTGDVGQRNFRWKESGETAASDFLNWDQLKHLSDHGWEIASHSSEHIHHSKQTASRQTEIIAKSFYDLESKLGSKPISFAYPYGDFNSDTVQAVRSAGFQVACTTKLGANSAASDSLHLNRIPLGGYKLRHLLRSDVQLLRYAR